MYLTFSVQEDNENKYRLDVSCYVATSSLSKKICTIIAILCRIITDLHAAAQIAQIEYLVTWQSIDVIVDSAICEAGEATGAESVHLTQWGGLHSHTDVSPVVAVLWRTEPSYCRVVTIALIHQNLLQTW